MAKLTNVFCTYTGGGVYTCTAQLDDSTWFATDLDLYGTYDVPYAEIEARGDCDYDSHWKDVPQLLPTWFELLNAIKDSYNRGISTNVDMDELERILLRNHPNLFRRVDGEAPNVTPLDPHTERLETIGSFIDVFEDFLEEKGIDIPNDEKEQSEGPCIIYGTDYGILSDRIEELLIRLGYMKEEV